MTSSPKTQRTAKCSSFSTALPISSRTLAPIRRLSSCPERSSPLGIGRRDMASQLHLASLVLSSRKSALRSLKTLVVLASLSSTCEPSPSSPSVFFSGTYYLSCLRSLEIFAFFMLTGIFSTLLIPETKQRTLEDLSNEQQDGFIQGVAGNPTATPIDHAAPQLAH